MLDTTEIGIFTALGVAFAAGLLFLALWGKQNPLRVSAYALIAVAFMYVGFAFRSLDPNSWVAVEMTGVAIFGSLAYMSIIFSPWFLVVGLALHPLWAIVFHYNGSGAVFTPAPFALANAGFDAALALYAVYAILQRAKAKTPAGVAQDKSRARQSQTQKRQGAMNAPAEFDLRHDWSVDEIVAIHDSPLLDLVARANAVHRRHFDPSDVQKAALLSIKTGGCPEDCSYCPQSAHHREVKLDRVDLLGVEEVLGAARTAREAGADRFCMGAAWRSAPRGPRFDAVVEMVRGVRALGMEACVTLGMVDAEQAKSLAEAGLTAYNHNLDTGPEFYGEIITTRTYEDRLETLKAVRGAGLEMCCGGIIGMGESVKDRAGMLAVLAGFDPHPESVPINTLVAVEGTPLAGRPPLDSLDLVRMIATTRIVMPKSRVRLSAGRSFLSREAQILCLVAGANSIFYGEKLLTTGNAGVNEDDALFAALAGRAEEAQCTSTIAFSSPG